MLTVYQVQVMRNLYGVDKTCAMLTDLARKGWITPKEHFFGCKCAKAYKLNIDTRYAKRYKDVSVEQY